MIIDRIRALLELTIRCLQSMLQANKVQGFLLRNRVEMLVGFYRKLAI